jgi:Protein of unknown function (DUF4231)
MKAGRGRNTRPPGKLPRITDSAKTAGSIGDDSVATSPVKFPCPVRRVRLVWLYLIDRVTDSYVHRERQKNSLRPKKMISPEEYIEQRLNDQISWYDRKSSTNQLWFKRLRFAEIVAAATIPFLSGFAGDSLPIKIAIGALGVLVAVIASVLGLLHLQEHWIEYRATAESLRREKFLFLTQTDPYDKDDAFHLLVQRVEALLSKENTEWTQSTVKPPKAENHA